jgi:hypothetical protein
MAKKSMLSFITPNNDDSKSKHVLTDNLHVIISLNHYKNLVRVFLFTAWMICGCEQRKLRLLISFIFAVAFTDTSTHIFFFFFLIFFPA